MNRRKKTLIVGGAGFVGNSLVQHFSEHSVELIVADTQSRIDKYARQVPNCEYIPIKWPLESEIPALQEVMNIVHLAWSSNPSTSMSDISDDTQRNVLGTVSLLQQVGGHDISKFTFMSSGGTVYGNPTENLVTEDSPTNPISAYGISKLTCEKYLSLFAARDKYKYLNIRLGNPYGEYQLQGTPIGVIANFILKASNNEPFTVFGNGDIVRDFIHIDDVSTLLFLAMQQEIESGTYNLGSGIGYSVSEIIDEIQGQIQNRINIASLPSRDSDVKQIVLDSRKIQSAVNYTPKISLTEGISSLWQECLTLNKIGPALTLAA